MDNTFLKVEIKTFYFNNSSSHEGKLSQGLLKALSSYLFERKLSSPFVTVVCKYICSHA